MELLGIATELAERRKRYQGPARPVPVETKAEQLRWELRKVQGQLDAVKADANRLREENRQMRERLAEVEAMGDLWVTSRTPTISNIIRCFVAEYNKLAIMDHRACLDVADLLSPRTNRCNSWPRHVCMAVCKELAKGASFPAIGRAFGGKDHTSVMYALRKYPQRIRERPDLAVVADRVRVHFGHASHFPMAEAA